MNQGMVNTVIAAIVGGVVGAGVVFFADTGSKVDFANLELEKLTVAHLAITSEATLLNGEGNTTVALRDGSVMAENLVVAHRLAGHQMQGHVFVANRFFCTPDNVFNTPINNWRFFAEIGASPEVGGEIVVRSAGGPALVDRATSGGAFLRAGFDTESQPQIVALQNLTGSVLPISQDLSPQQRQMLATANQQRGVMPQGQGFDGQANPVMPNFGREVPGSTATPGMGIQ